MLLIKRGVLNCHEESSSVVVRAFRVSNVKDITNAKNGFNSHIHTASLNVSIGSV